MKRVFDIVVSLVAGLLLLPTILIIAALVRVKLGKPILFKQVRPGQNGHLFTILKFRTMTNHKTPSGELLDDEVRLTSFGKFLRSTSMDELPELWNVIRGDMSLVGPRPLLVEYLPLYNEKQKQRHNIRPGITGWSQVIGRNALSWDDKLELDVWYVQNQSLWLDIKIIMLTVWVILSRKGISAEGHVTMPKFKGGGQ